MNNLTADTIQLGLNLIKVVSQLFDQSNQSTSPESLAPQVVPMYRQGDVLLVKREELPPKCVRVSAKSRVILAYGETTGHAHAISTQKARLFELDSQLFVETADGAVLEHEEHASIQLPRGVYTVVRQREFDMNRGDYTYVRD